MRLGIIAGLLVLGVDQASKYWVLNVLDLPDLRQVVLLPVLNLTMVWNQGVTFGLLNGLGSWSHFVLAGIALAVVGALFLWLRRADNALAALSIGSIAGGAVGNVIDRLRYGAVVDFIHAHIGAWSWYVFNVADAAIVCGVAVLILETQFLRRSKPGPGGGPVGGPSGGPVESSGGGAGGEPDGGPRGTQGKAKYPV
jgi:lipoprotein signal peptidase